MAYVTASEVYQKTGLSSSEVDLSTYTEIIADAEREVEVLTGRKFSDANTATEFLNGPKSDMLGFSGSMATTVRVRNYPIQSITSFLILNVDGTTNTTYSTLSSASIAAGTYDTTDYWLDTMVDPVSGNVVPTGTIRLKTATFPTGYNNVKVAYTYGYSSVPTIIRDLAGCLAGVRSWIRFLGGGYNRLNSYSIPQQSVSKGDFYQRGKQNIDELTALANELLSRIGRRSNVLMFATGQDR